MPFPDHAGMITCLLQHLGHSRLRSIEPIEHGHAINMTIFAGENARAARAANRVYRETVQESHSLFGDTIQIRRLIDLASITAHRMGRMIVGHDEEDIWTLRRLRLGRNGRQAYPENGQEVQRQTQPESICSLPYSGAFGL